MQLEFEIEKEGRIAYLDIKLETIVENDEIKRKRKCGNILQ